MSEEKKKVKKPKSKTRKIIEWVLTGIFLALFAVLGVAQIDGMVHKKDHFGQTLKFGYATFVVRTDSMADTAGDKSGYGVDTALITHLDDAAAIYKDYQKGKTVDLTFWYDINCYNEVVNSGHVEPQNHPDLKTRTNPPDYPIITHRLMEMYENPSIKKGEGRYTFIVAGINRKSKNLGWKEGDPEITITQYQAFTEKYLLGRVVVGSAFLGGVFNFVSSIWGLLILLLIPAFYLLITSFIDIFRAYKDPDEEPAVIEGPSSNGEKKNEVELSEADKKRLKEELLQEMLAKKKGDQ